MSHSSSSSLQSPAMAYDSSTDQSHDGQSEDLNADSDAGLNIDSTLKAPRETVQTPIHEAVNFAFDHSDAASRIDPALIAQITEQVSRQVLDTLKNNPLQGYGLPPQQQQQQQQTSRARHQPSAPQQQQQQQQAYYPPPPPHPPPSAQFPPPSTSSNGATSPQHQPRRSQQGSPPLPGSYPAARSPETSSSSSAFPLRDAYTPPSPDRRDSLSQGSISPEPPANRRSWASRPRGRSQPEVPEVGVSERRSKSDMGEEETTLEKIWQPLFTADNKPTHRLSQFLRGVALHLVEDYEPKNSLIITPSKMLRFYNEIKLPNEHYPWQTIFGKLTNSCVSRLYREMKAEHFLTQTANTESPCIPSLTPGGFQTWMTAMIQAYPQTEYERLARAVLTMPISNADNRRERFPKELSRRLFPRDELLQAQQRIAAAMSHADSSITLPRMTAFPPPPPPPQSQQTPKPTSNLSSNIERERAPYSGAPRPSVASVSSEDDGDSPVAVKIERERKPYAAMPGGGKVYDDEKKASKMNIDAASAAAHSSTNPKTPSSTTPSSAQFAKANGGVNASTTANTSANLRRATSSAGQSSRGMPPVSSAYHRDHGPPPTSMTRGIPNTMSTAGAGGLQDRHHYRGGSGQSTGSASGYSRRLPRASSRSRSPTTFANPYTRSEGGGVNDIHRSYYESNLYDRDRDAGPGRNGSASIAVDDDDLFSSSAPSSHGLERSNTAIPMSSSTNSANDLASSVPRNIDPRKYASANLAAAAEHHSSSSHARGSVSSGHRPVSMYEDEYGMPVRGGGPESGGSGSSGGGERGGYYDRRRNTMSAGTGGTGPPVNGGWAEGGRRYQQ